MLKVKVSSEPSLRVSAKGPASAVVKVQAIAKVAGSSINISGASVGQIIKIAEVNDKGEPTAWEAFWLSELEASGIEALETLAECGVIVPAYQDGVFYTDASGAIYVL